MKLVYDLIAQALAGTNQNPDEANVPIRWFWLLTCAC